MYCDKSSSGPLELQEIPRVSWWASRHSWSNWSTKIGSLIGRICRNKRFSWPATCFMEPPSHSSCFMRFGIHKQPFYICCCCYCCDGCRYCWCCFCICCCFFCHPYCWTTACMSLRFWNLIKVVAKKLVLIGVSILYLL